MSLNEKLQQHQAATMRSYSDTKPYDEALKIYKEVNKRRAEKLVSRDKKLKRKERLLPPKKI